MIDKIYNFPKLDERGFYHTVNQMGFMLTELDPFVADFIVQASSPFLDIGCGVGNSFYPLLERKPNLKVNAFDISKRAVSMAAVK